MRGIAIFICVFLLSGTTVLKAQSFYDSGTISVIEITFESSNWDQQLDNLAAVGEERLLANVTVNGEVFDSVGVRYKGNSSYNANNAKNPLNIKLDYIIDQKYEDYGTLKLSNGFKDPSFVREVLGYEIARKYMPAPLSNYAKVYINGDYVGLYTSNQDVDKQFMRTHFVDGENARFKGEINEAKGPTGGVWQYLGADSTDYATKFVIESTFGWDDLIFFLYTLNNNNSEVFQELNMDRHLWFLAFSNLLVNLDGPINNPQNHYLFQDMSGRFNPIPWDLNECFGVFSMVQTSSYPMNTQALQQLDPYLNINEVDFPVVSEILSVEKYRKMYVAHMKTIIEENFSNGWYEDRAYELQDVISTDYVADNNTFYSYSEMSQNVISSVGSVGPPPNQSVPGIAEIMDARITYLMGLSDFSVQAPEILASEFVPEFPEAGDEVSFTVEVENADNVYLAFRYDDYSIFTKLEMFDDGAHNDGFAGDNIYGVYMIPGAVKMNYYFYSANADAAAFLPVRAEYEFFSLELSTDLVINEFLASNQGGQADSYGEDDDWIELFNNGSETINLAGCFLSDKADEPDKWMFPDTVIESGQYLIVWADNDSLQTGLHAGFKLSSGGESVVLSAPDLSLIDYCSFDAQNVNESTGRYPNGIGDFCSMTPTYSAENLLELSSEIKGDEFDLILYPNPVQSDLLISGLNQVGESVNVSIFCSTGKIVFSDIVTENELRLSVDSFVPGMYVVLISASGDQRFLKFVKE